MAKAIVVRYGKAWAVKIGQVFKGICDSKNEANKLAKKWNGK